MLSLTPPKPLSLFLQNPHHSPFLNLHHTTPLILHHTTKPHLLKPLSASSPSSSPSSPSLPPNQVYQPFHPPPPKPTSLSLSLDSILDTLRNRLGLWHEYAPLISTLSRHHSFSPSAIEEATGISGVDQNRLVVGAQVRDSLISYPSLDPNVLSFFDIGGAELLYELRLLSAPQRAAASRRIAALRLDPRDAQELARAMKDFPRRRGDDGWESFSPVPGDCLAFMHFRQSKEQLSPVERTAALERALEAAETERARQRIEQELGKNSGDGDAADDGKVRIKVPVVRMKTGEVAEATTVVVLPVVREEAGEVESAPGWRTEGEFGVVVAEKAWRRWVVLPGWAPVAGMGTGGGVVVTFSDGRVLPWKVNRGYREEEILVVVDRERKEVLEDEGFYLIGNGEKGGLGVVRGDILKEKGESESLGMVVLVVRPPKEEVEDQLQDEDWE